MSLGQVRSAASLPPPYQTGCAVPGGVIGKRDGVPGDLAGVGHAVPQPDQHPGLVQPGEELLGAGRGCGGGGDVAAQRGPGWLVPSVAGGFAGLGAGRGRAAVRSAGAVDRSPYRCSAASACIPDPVPLVLHAGPGPVLAGQHRHQVDVVRAVPDRDPPHRVVFRPRAGTARYGASHPPRCRPIRRPTAGGPRGRRASSSARPAWRTPTCRARRAGAAAARPGGGSPGSRWRAAGAPGQRAAR